MSLSSIKNPDDLLKRAIHAHQRGEYESAARIYNKLLKAFPDHHALYAHLGHALKSQGKFEQAIEAYRRSLDKEAHNRETLNGMGSTVHDQGRFDEAEIWYRKALDVDPNYAEALNNLGCALQDQGRRHEAMPCYRKALRIAPDLLGVALNLHSAIFDDRDLKPAADILESALKIEPENYLIRFYLGVIREEQGDVDQARVLLDPLHNSTCAKVRPLLQGWDYIKSRRTPETRLFGDTFETLAYALSATDIDGLTLEFGVNFGTTIRYIGRLTDGPVHGFDSFEGLPESWKHEAAGRYSTGGILPDTPDNVTLHKGWFKDTLPPFLKGHAGPVCFVHVDCDIYSSTKTVFDNIGTRLVPGSVIVFDEYITNPDWQEDEFKAFQEAVHSFELGYEYLAFSLGSKQAAVRIT